MSVCEYFLTCHSLVFAVIAIRALYGALTSHVDAKIFLLFLGSGTWIYLEGLYTFLSQVHQASYLALKGWHEPGRGGPGFKFFLRSCRPFKVEIAGLFYVDRGMPLNMATIILDRIVNMLVA